MLVDSVRAVTPTVHIRTSHNGTVCSVNYYAPNRNGARAKALPIMVSQVIHWYLTSLELLCEGINLSWNGLFQSGPTDRGFSPLKPDMEDYPIQLRPAV